MGINSSGYCCCCGWLNLFEYFARAYYIDFMRVNSCTGSTSLLKYFVRKSLKLENANIGSPFLGSSAGTYMTSSFSTTSTWVWKKPSPPIISVCLTITVFILGGDVSMDLCISLLRSMLFSSPLVDSTRFTSSKSLVVPGFIYSVLVVSMSVVGRGWGGVNWIAASPGTWIIY